MRRIPGTPNHPPPLPARSEAVQGTWQPSYAMAVFHPASAPPLDGLFDDLSHAVVSKAANVVQSAASAASSLPGPAGAVARAIAAPAAAAAKAASAGPGPVTPPSSTTRTRPHPSSSQARTPPAKESSEPGSSLVLPLAVGGAAIAVAGGAVWWTRMNHEHGHGHGQHEKGRGRR